jgi:hypothetical protein
MLTSAFFFILMQFHFQEFFHLFLSKSTKAEMDFPVKMEEGGEKSL